MDNKGQSLVIFVLLLPIIFIILSIIWELGNMQLQISQYENAIKDNIKYGLSIIYTILLTAVVITYLFKNLIGSIKEGVVNAKPYGKAQIGNKEKNVKISYIDGDDFHFMDQETYEDVMLSKEDLGDNAGYISPDDDYDVTITYYEGKPVGVKLPINVVRVITYCEPGIKGDTSGKSLKPATLDTGMEVRVPLFCNTDDKIIIDTRDGSFVERAKDK